ncbi:hypothetical protein TIFTF001_031388 [Ficus carica]|uniref:RNase H type-1 domain-containing protein n=1 Tax=Ficus carica TaxID=3494 RepID=A0AA88J0X0_FICCA|nr:hypothetical protein TIFTF001_031388 [Ficus carica]
MTNTNTFLGMDSLGGQVGLGEYPQKILALKIIWPPVVAQTLTNVTSDFNGMLYGDAQAQVEKVKAYDSQTGYDFPYFKPALMDGAMTRQGLLTLQECVGEAGILRVGGRRFCVVAWNPSRNYMEVIDAAGRFLGDCSVGEKFNSVPASPPVVEHRGWLAPPVGGLKLYIDTAVKQAECLAVLEGLECAVEGGLSISIVESDVTNVITAIRNYSLSASKGPVKEDIRNLLIQVGCDTCTSVVRSGNRVAHCLANLVCFDELVFSGCTCYC